MFPKRQSGFEIVGNFYRASEALVAQSFLQSEGIEAWVVDETQIRMQWQLAAALGGVKVAVSPSDAARARELLAQDRSAELQEVAEQQLPAAPEELCPRCGGGIVAASIERKRPMLHQLFVSLCFAVWGYLLPMPRSAVHRKCGTCGYAWSTIENR
jgi:ribosomal protein S27AE